LQSWQTNLSNRIVIEESSQINNKELKNREINIEQNNIVQALVTFRKDNVVKAKFRFELSNRTNIVNNLERKRIRALHIQFL
jgi:hypothetical protein